MGGVRWVNLDAALKHLPDYISAEGDAQRKAKAAELLAALSNNLFRASAGFFAHVFTIVCAGSKLVQANRGVTIDAMRGLVHVMCSQLAHLRTHVLEGGWESRLCVDPAISPVRGSRACSPFDKSLDGFNPCLTTRRRLIDFVKSPNLFKISTSIVVNTGTLVTMNQQLLVSLELVRVSGL